MKALTVCQPYASRIVRGQKRVENRVWYTGYRGLLAIHAGQSREWFGREAVGAGMPFGAVLGVCALVDCLHIEDIEDGEHDAAFPWLRRSLDVSGPWCWVFESVLAFPSAIPCRGAHRLWEWEAEPARYAH